ncbi:MAG: DsbA family protein [Acidobacteriia bacterium]|nr:DsbA family protein [Terriglobia bacterium]
MARARGFSLNIVFLLVLLGAGCKAQNPGSLSPEVSRRIQTEIRARYSVPQQITIALSEPKPSDIPGYDTLQITFTGGSKPATLDFLLAKDRKTVARMEKIDISQDLMSRIDVKGRPIRGKADAKVTIVNFDDFQCPFCSRMHATLFPGLLEAYGGQVRFIYKDYPLVEIHPWAMHAAVNANCLGDQSNDAYWTYADSIHAAQQEFRGKNLAEAIVTLDKSAKDQGVKYKLDAAKLDACVKKQDESGVRASMAEAEKLGVDSTPTLFINGEKVSGAVPFEDMRAILDRALAENGQPSAAPSAKK